MKLSKKCDYILRILSIFINVYKFLVLYMIKRRKQTSKPHKQKAPFVCSVLAREHGDIFTDNQTTPTSLARGVSQHII